MNTPDWMIEAPTPAPRRAKPARHNRRSTDRLGLNVVDISLAFLAMLATMWGICELNSLMLR
jgi:hypothetical protein